MVKYCGRPDNFSDIIAKNLFKLTSEDTLIHLGDVGFGNTTQIHNQYIVPLKCKKWLTLGNHDKENCEWYMNHGWDFACYSFTITLFKKRILFSHIPRDITDHDYNIFGHFHNNPIENCEPELIKKITERHKLFILENLEYKSVPLNELIK